MAYSNSTLVSHTRISPNKTSPRNHAIDTITIHMVCGQCFIESLGEVFASPTRNASSNYGIGKDGKIGLFVEEKDRSWCSDSSANDGRAVTIEVASGDKPPYAVNAAAYDALIELVADICRRNGIKKLVWSENKDDRINHRNGCNMTIHKDFADTACPGEYLQSRMGEIAEKVNAKLGGSTMQIKTNDVVKITAGATYYDGKAIPSWIIAQNWIVKSVSGDRAVIDKSEDGQNSICSPVNVKYLTVVKSANKAPATSDKPADTSSEDITITLYTLRQGEHRGSAQIATAQRILKSLGLYSMGIDSSFGPGMEKAVKGFQAAKGLNADGVIGKDTWTALLK